MATTHETAQRTGLKASALEAVISGLIALAVALVLLLGWLTRHSRVIEPEHGLGYALGIIGGSLMLALMIYPIRKRMRGTKSSMGSVGFWFRFHMLLGLLGPVAILFHARFSWGALNSGVALGAMLIVAGSGLIGRYFYSRVHRGYSGRKLELRALHTEMHDMLGNVQILGAEGQAVTQLLTPFEQKAVSASASFWSSAMAVITVGISTRLANRKVHKHIVHGEPNPALRVRIGLLVDAYFEAARRAAEFAFYDRLLRLWHLLHLPLFLLLVVTAIVHIIAVHMY